MMSVFLPVAQRVIPLIVSLTLMIVESGASSKSGAFSKKDTSAATTILLASWRARVDACVKAVAQGNYRANITEAQSLLAEAARFSRPDLEIRIRLALGGALMGAGQYRNALQTLLSARTLAIRYHDNVRLYALNNNIAWIYLKMERLGVAAEFADQALSAARSSGKYDPRLVILRALIFAKQHNFQQSDVLFLEAINRSLDAGDLKLAASAWDNMGRGYSGANLPGAERALTESFRLRKLHHLPELEVSMRDLAEIIADRGDLQTSTVLLDEAVSAMGNPKSTTDTWGFLLDRGRVRMMRGNLSGALRDLRSALNLARRLDVIPTDDDRVTFEAGLAELYALFIDCGNRLYLQTRDSHLKEETFEVAEENRAASLRAVVPQPHDWRSSLPPEHAEALASLLESERSLLNNPGRAAELRVRTLRARLDEIEQRARSSVESPGGSALKSARQALDPDTAVLSFSLGTGGSWVWLLQGDSFEVYPLPPKRELTSDVESFRDAIQNRTASSEMGDTLGRKLLGALPAEIDRKHRWIVTLDGGLFDLPLAALRRNGRYLAEDHALLVTPGIRLLKAAGNRFDFLGKLTAVGDPVYNRADKRWGGRSMWSEARQFLGFRSPDPWHLARLTGTGQEVHTALENWGDGTALVGANATKAQYLQLSSQNPAIVHLATHVIRAARDDRAGMIVFGLNGQGEPEFLGMREILLRPSSVKLVVMSGCASGDAEALPASGLMGLTRAWLGAGVDDVLATRWASLDDNGPFFASFYSALRINPKGGAAEALRLAQVEMIQSHSFRNSPEYWATYFLTGKR